MSNPQPLPPPTADDKVPARILAIELETRIATQPLHYRSGDEETAAKSLKTLFDTTRDLLAEHTEARAFATAAIFLLNQMLRPNTARWHRWMVDGKFNSELSRRQFRYELQLLRPQLKEFQELLDIIASGEAKATAVFAALVKSQPSVDERRVDLGPSVRPRFAEEVEPKSGGLPEGIKEGAAFLTAQQIEKMEHATIRQRRVALGSPETELQNASGLCLSGGGIRSATFSLGIVQVLARQGLFEKFDYLSTVSGGGYLGTFLTSYLGAARTGSEKIRDVINDAFVAQSGREPDAIRHLRNNSRYLISGGVWARLKMLGLVLTGIVTNTLLLLPLPLLAVLLVWLLVQVGAWSPDGIAAPSLRGTPVFQVFKYAALVFGVAWLALPLIRNIARGKEWNSLPAKTRSFWEAMAVVLGVIVLLIAALVVVPGFFQIASAIRYHRLNLSFLPGIRRLLESEKALAAIAALAPLFLGLFAAKAKPGTRKKKWLTLLFALSGPVLAFAVFLIVGNRSVGPDPVWLIGRVAFVTGLITLWGWLFVDINEFSPHRYYRNRLCECYLAVPQRSERGAVRSLIRRILHGRKKDETHSKSHVGVLRQLALSEINKSGAAPYHLINCAVNLPASLEPNLRGREADFFAFTRDYCGGPVCGYIKTDVLEKLDPNMDVGTAMAVSGAAASVNMGVKTLKHLRFLLTLLNVRLGYWLRNPAVGPRHWWNPPGPRYLFREMTGWMHEKSGYLNLSDGGHIENLALYEMLRRRCKFIVVIDGGMEPGMEAADLMLAQRYAEIDLGIRFEIDLADLALDANRRSRAYAVFGKIHYRPHSDNTGEHDLGWLVYFHLAHTGSEPGYVMDYARQNPDFPHQTTGDQIYDEAQFEAYRRLGECAAESLFRPEISEPFIATRPDPMADESAPVFKTLDDWFAALASSLLPDNDPAFKPTTPPASPGEA
ncbi:MAG TPA: patatin-like phospholipase family protein [Chthoniobacterales bacterium]|nr:patatin-like phospholipase family protein [Chthoniobacterales bacterium]